MLRMMFYSFLFCLIAWGLLLWYLHGVVVYMSMLTIIC
jgi:hypothetical protein